MPKLNKMDQYLLNNWIKINVPEKIEVNKLFNLFNDTFKLHNKQATEILKCKMNFNKLKRICSDMGITVYKSDKDYVDYKTEYKIKSHLQVGQIFVKDSILYKILSIKEQFIVTQFSTINQTGKINKFKECFNYFDIQGIRIKTDQGWKSWVGVKNHLN